MSESLPLFVASAYSLFLEHRMAEALLDAWIVIEQIVDHWWQAYRSDLNDRSLAKKLDDNRTYSASVRIDFLHSMGILDINAYKLIDAARDHRNKLAHRTIVDDETAYACMLAMKTASSWCAELKWPDPSRTRPLPSGNCACATAVARTIRRLWRYSRE